METAFGLSVNAASRSLEVFQRPRSWSTVLFADGDCLRSSCLSVLRTGADKDGMEKLRRKQRRDMDRKEEKRKEGREGE